MRAVPNSRVMFLYWGRRGLTQFVYELASAAQSDPHIDSTISVSRQNENVALFDKFSPHVFHVDTFSSNLGALTQAWRIPQLRKQLASRLSRDGTQVVIELMPHVWSSAIASVIREAGARYVTIVHDADTHPGDYRTAFVKRMLDSAMDRADLVITLSEAVAGRLSGTGLLSRDKIYTLFHPDLGASAALRLRTLEPDAPFKIMWLGRIMPYKGLPLFLDAVDILREAGYAIEVGVFGEGNLGSCLDRLTAMGAEVVNRWLTEAQTAALLDRFDAVVLSHTEASQSGIVATALGAGVPPIATPVGGLIEQIADGQTGMLASRADAPALADAILRLMHDPQLYAAICRNIVATREQRSISRFVEDIVSHALYAGNLQTPV